MSCPLMCARPPRGTTRNRIPFTPLVGQFIWTLWRLLPGKRIQVLRRHVAYFRGGQPPSDLAYFPVWNVRPHRRPEQPVSGVDRVTGSPHRHSLADRHAVRRQLPLNRALDWCFCVLNRSSRLVCTQSLWGGIYLESGTMEPEHPKSERTNKTTGVLTLNNRLYRRNPFTRSALNLHNWTS